MFIFKFYVTRGEDYRIHGTMSIPCWAPECQGYAQRPLLCITATDTLRTTTMMERSNSVSRPNNGASKYRITPRPPIGRDTICGRSRCVIDMWTPSSAQELAISPCASDETDGPRGAVSDVRSVTLRSDWWREVTWPLTSPGKWASRTRFYACQGPHPPLQEDIHMFAIQVYG